MEPCKTGKGTTIENNLGPEPSSFIVSFKTGRCAVGNYEAKETVSAGMQTRQNVKALEYI